MTRDLAVLSSLNRGVFRYVVLVMTLRAMVLCCFFLAASLVCDAQQASSELQLQPLSGGLLTVRAVISGHEGKFLFDSGSGVSNITPEFAAKIGCKPWGQISGLRMTGERLDMRRCDNVTVHLGAYESDARTVGVFDLKKILPASMSDIDGTIALDVFEAHALTLSYSHHLLQILDRASLAKNTAGKRSMPVHLVRDAEGMALTVNLPVTTVDGIAWFEMDSGNTSSWVIVGKHLCPYFGLDASRKGPQPVALSLADGSRFVGSAQVLDVILDGNLGTSFLTRYDVTLDLLNSLAWVTPATGASLR